MKRLLLPLLAALALPINAFADTLDVEFEDTIYTIQSKQASDNLEFDPTIIQSEPWYGSESAAETFLDEINLQLGNYLGSGSYSNAPVILWKLPTDESIYSS